MLWLVRLCSVLLAFGLGGCAVKDGQPCIIQPDLSCDVLGPPTEADPDYIDPTGVWRVENIYGDVWNIRFRHTLANTMIINDNPRDRLLYQGNNVWEAEDGSEVIEFYSSSSGYWWSGDPDVGEAEVFRIK